MKNKKNCKVCKHEAAKANRRKRVKAKRSKSKPGVFDKFVAAFGDE